MLTAEQLRWIRATSAYEEVGPKEDPVEVRVLLDEIIEMRQAMRMIDYVAMTIHEASSEGGSIDRARDIRKRAQKFIDD